MWGTPPLDCAPWNRSTPGPPTGIASGGSAARALAKTPRSRQIPHTAWGLPAWRRAPVEGSARARVGRAHMPLRSAQDLHHGQECPMDKGSATTNAPWTLAGAALSEPRALRTAPHSHPHVQRRVPRPPRPYCAPQPVVPRPRASMKGRAQGDRGGAKGLVLGGRGMLKPPATGHPAHLGARGTRSGAL